jgi:hypothetical protein
MTVKVPDVPGPAECLCWKQAPNMTRCDRRKGHEGPHSWEWEARLDEVTRERDGYKADRDATVTSSLRQLAQLQARLAPSEKGAEQ